MRRKERSGPGMTAVEGAAAVSAPEAVAGQTVEAAQQPAINRSAFAFPWEHRRRGDCMTRPLPHAATSRKSPNLALFGGARKSAAGRAWHCTPKRSGRNKRQAGFFARKSRIRTDSGQAKVTKTSYLLLGHAVEERIGERTALRQREVFYVAEGEGRVRRGVLGFYVEEVGAAHVVQHERGARIVFRAGNFDVAEIDVLYVPHEEAMRRRGAEPARFR